MLESAPSRTENYMLSRQRARGPIYMGRRTAKGGCPRMSCVLTWAVVWSEVLGSGDAKS